MTSLRSWMVDKSGLFYAQNTDSKLKVFKKYFNVIVCHSYYSMFFKEEGL